MRSALIVATSKYLEPKLKELRAPATDATELADVLKDPKIGDFEDVEVLVNQPESVLRRRLHTFFSDRRLDDLLLLHFSCHGVKDDAGHLFFATTDTELDALDATAVPSDFVNSQMVRCRSRRIALFLDCCYSGAFSPGLVSKGDRGMDLNERFEGRGRVVLTASNSMEYAFEGDDVEGEGRPSLFTTAVVEGLRTGAADYDGDSWVGVDELYDYVFDRVNDATPNQTPSKWSFDVQGDLLLAHNPFPPEIKPARLPDELVAGTKSPLQFVREGAVRELGRLVESNDPALVMAAQHALEPFLEDDSNRIRELARSYTDRVEEGPTPATLASDTTARDTEQPRQRKDKAAAPDADLGRKRTATPQPQPTAKPQAQPTAKPQAQPTAKPQAQPTAKKPTASKAEPVPSGPRAGFGRRLGGWLIDSTLLLVPFASLAGGLKGVGAAVGLLLWLAYYVGFEGAAAGQTLGKRALSIRVVDLRSGGPIGYKRALVRTLGRIVSALPIYLGYFSMLWDDENQTWHDRFAQSVVVPATPSSVEPPKRHASSPRGG